MNQHVKGLEIQDQIEVGEDENPICDEANPKFQGTSFSCIVEGQRGASPEQHPPEQPSRSGPFDHLQWDCDGPIDIPVDNEGLKPLHPVPAHIHVVHGCDQRQAALSLVAGGAWWCGSVPAPLLRPVAVEEVRRAAAMAARTPQR